MAKQLTYQHIAAQRRLQDTTSAAIERSFSGLGSWNDADVDRFLRQAVPIISAAQRQSTQLTDSFVAAFRQRRPLGVSPVEVGRRTRNGVLPAEVYRRPFVTLWKGLKEGRQFEDAYNAALSRATASAAMDVQLAMRETSDLIDERDDGFFGYVRVANGDACPFCEEVDGAYVKASDGFAMALHNGCNCGLEPNSEPHVGAVNLPNGTEVRPYQYGPLNDSVAVHEHGELGPVLGNPEHDFTLL